MNNFLLSQQKPSIAHRGAASAECQAESCEARERGGESKGRVAGLDLCFPLLIVCFVFVVYFSCGFVVSVGVLCGLILSVFVCDLLSFICGLSVACV